MFAFVETLRQDFRYAWRALRHSRAFTAWVVSSLAIGIAVTIAALAVLNATMVLPFPHVAEQKRLVRVSVSRTCGRPDCWINMSGPLDYDALRAGLIGVQDLAAYTTGDVAVALPDARSLRSVVASANYFDVLGVRPALGRVFNRSDAESHDAVVVIAHRTWTREFGGDPAIIGRSIRVADQFVQIVGVAPELFVGIDRPRSRSIEAGRSPDLWLPMWLVEHVLPPTPGEQARQERAFSFVGRLKDGIDLPQLQAETRVLARRLAAPHGDTPQDTRADVQRVWRVNPRNWQFGVITVLPIPILILAIACVNAANLMLARGSQRQREIAIRLAIGAGRGRIVRQLLIESGILALIASSVAVMAASWSLQLASNPFDTRIPIDTTVLVLTLMTAVGTTVAFGLAPAVRVSAQRPSSTLGPIGARGDAAPQQSRLRRALIVAQVALSLGLLATGSQLVGTVRSQAVSAGTPADRLLLARFDLQPLNLASAEAESFYDELSARASRLPGVEAVGVARHTSVWTFGRGAAAAALSLWRATDRHDEGQPIIGGYVAGNLFEAVGLRILAGRGFTDADRQRIPQVAVVNETTARMLNGPAVGSIIRVAPRGQAVSSAIDVRIVGLVEGAREPRLEMDERPAAKVYLPSPIEPEAALALYVRTRAPATTVAQPIRELVSQIAPRVPVLEIGSLEELNERSYATQLWLARAATALGVIGLLLATAGLYGVSSYVVAMRSREIAIRIAIGARPHTILTMILTQSMRIAAIGLIVGGFAALAASRFIQSEYHGIRGIDATAFGLAVALFLAAMSLASVVPAVRASHIDPVESLKEG